MRSLSLILLLFLAFGHNSFAQPLTLNSIRLMWEDFQVRDYASGPYTAQVSVPIRYKMAPKDNSHFLFESEAYIDVTRSRVNKNFLDQASYREKQELLNHEKCHVVVAYIHHKKLQQMMTQHQFQLSIKAETDSMVAQIDRGLREQNRAYDSATDHGRRKAEQAIWERKLLKELNILHPDGVIYTAASISIKKPSFLKFDDTAKFDYANMQLVFEENFDDDRRGWLIGAEQDTGITTSISNGMLEINNTRINDNAAYGIEENIDYSRNFEVHLSFMIRKAAGKYKRAGGVYWGSAGAKGFSWCAIGRTEAEMINCHGGDHKQDKKKKGSIYPALKEGIFHTIVVRKLQDKYTIFVNDKLTAALPYEILPGNKLVLAADSESVIVYDYLKIYYLD